MTSKGTKKNTLPNVIPIQYIIPSCINLILIFFFITIVIINNKGTVKQSMSSLTD